jgi:SPP1 gp7 family putative phage head morphogenesis protein
VKLTDRLRAAVGLVMKGTPFPFNKIIDFGSLVGGLKLDHPYKKSAWVMRAIKLISAPIAAVNIQFALSSKGSEQFIQDEDLAAFWQRPARTSAAPMTFYDFIEANVGWLKLEGEAFWILDDSWLVPFPKGPRSPMIMVRPDRMRHIVSRSGELIGWEYTDGARKRHVLIPEQVIHPMLWNPYDEYRGLPEYLACSTAAEADFLAGQFNLNLMRNNGDQGAFIVAKGGIPTDEQRTQIVEQLREKRELSQRGVFKPMFLTGEITIEDPKMRAPDAAFISARVENKHEIFIALGVPASMADVTASYSIGSASDRYRLIEDTCMPLGERIADHVAQVELMRSGKALRATFDWSRHSVMQQVRMEYLKSADGLWSKGMPMKQINEYLRLGMQPFPGWDQGFLPFNIAPAGELASGEADPANDPSYAETSKVFRSIREAIEGRSKQRSEFQRGRSAKETALWKTHMSARRETAKAFESKFRAELFKVRQEVLSKIERSEAKSIARAAAADFMFDLERFREGLTASMRKVAATGLQTAGSQLFKELSKDEPFSMPPAKALEFLNDRENKLEGVADEVFDRIKGALKEGLDAGDSIKDLSNRIRGEFNELGRGRATVISMTETASCYGVARDEAMRQAGVQYKRWLTSGNPNVRPAHAAANGQTVKVEESFEVDGEALDHPADPNGAPENVINCHCVSIASEKPEEENT